MKVGMKVGMTAIVKERRWRKMIFYFAVEVLFQQRFQDYSSNPARALSSPYKSP